MKDTMQYFSEKLKIEYSVDLDNIPQEEWEEQIVRLYFHQIYGIGTK